MSIIYQSDAERKGPTPGLSVPSDTPSHWSRSNGRALWVLLWFCCDSRLIFGVRVTTPMPRTSRRCYSLS